MNRSVQHDTSTDKICAIQYEHCITGHLPLFKILPSESNSSATGYELLNICIMSGLCKWLSPSSQKEVGNLLTHPALFIQPSVQTSYLSSLLSKYATFIYLIGVNQNEQYSTLVNHSDRQDGY